MCCRVQSPQSGVGSHRTQLFASREIIRKIREFLYWIGRIAVSDGEVRAVRAMRDGNGDPQNPENHKETHKTKVNNESFYAG